MIAALSLALGACGGDDGGAPDAATLDATEVDAEVTPPDAAPTGPVTVTVTAGGAPFPGADVVFNNPDGSVNGVEQTGAGGQASRDLEAGGSATIVLGGTEFVGITFAAVQPGDQLSFDFAGESADVGDFLATVPVGPVAGATGYELSLGCATTTTTGLTPTISGDILEDCLGSDTSVDAMVFAVDNMGGRLAYDTLKDVPVVAGGGTTNLVFDAWQTTGTPLTVTFDNVPAGVPQAGYESHWRVDGVDFGGPQSGGVPVAEALTFDTDYPTGGFVDQLAYGMFFLYGASFADGFGIIIAGENGTPATVTRDLGALALPAITAASASASAGRVSLAWTAEGSMAGADGMLASIAWADTTPDTFTDRWFVLLPPDAASPYELPEIPSDLAEFVPGASATFGPPTVIFGEGDFIDGYDAWRLGAGYTVFNDELYDALPATGGVFRASVGGAL